MGRTRTPTQAPAWTLEDLQRRFRHIPARRIRLNPAPGTATEADVLRLMDWEGRLYELVDGVLVEKVMGAKVGGLGARLIRFLEAYGDEADLGTAFGADTTLRLMPGLVRIPDVSFVTWQRLPGKCYPEEPIPDLVPDLAVEVLSEGNTAAEMRQKLKEYFLAGARLVWLVDPAARSVVVYTAPDACRMLTEADTLDGGDVLPGFRLPPKKLFARLGPPGPAARKPRKRRGR